MWWRNNSSSLQEKLLCSLSFGTAAAPSSFQFGLHSALHSKFNLQQC